MSGGPDELADYMPPPTIKKRIKKIQKFTPKPPTFYVRLAMNEVDYRRLELVAQVNKTTIPKMIQRVMNAVALREIERKSLPDPAEKSPAIREEGKKPAIPIVEPDQTTCSLCCAETPASDVLKCEECETDGLCESCLEEHGCEVGRGPSREEVLTDDDQD